MRNMYDISATPGLMHLLGSHDTARIRTELGGSADRARLAAVLLLTATGAPLVYYGDEIGMEGGDDPDSRRCMEWDPKKQDQRILATHRALIRARRERPWLSWGAFEDVLVDDDRQVYAYRRSSTGPLAPADAPRDEMYVAVNTGDHPSDVCLPDGERIDLLTGKHASGGVTVGARDAAVLVPAT